MVSPKVPDDIYLRHIIAPASSREVAAKLGMKGTAVGAVGKKLSDLVRRGLATFDGEKFKAK